MTIKVIKNPCCKKCGSRVTYAITQILYHGIDELLIDTEDNSIDNLDLSSIEDAVDTGDPASFYCDGCGDINISQVIDESEWKDK